VNASASNPAVALRGGFVVPVDALLLAWSLENRGAVFAVEGGDLVIDGPTGFLTEADRAAIARWRAHLKAIVAYQPDGVLV